MKHLSNWRKLGWVQVRTGMAANRSNFRSQVTWQRCYHQTKTGAGGSTSGGRTQIHRNMGTISWNQNLFFYVLSASNGQFLDLVALSALLQLPNISWRGIPSWRTSAGLLIACAYIKFLELPVSLPEIPAIFVILSTTGRVLEHWPAVYTIQCRITEQRLVWQQFIPLIHPQSLPM